MSNIISPPSPPEYKFLKIQTLFGHFFGVTHSWIFPAELLLLCLVTATEASAPLSPPRNSRRHVHHGKQSTLANQTPGIDADVNFHDEVAKAAGVRLGLVWRIWRNQQPIAGFHLISLAAHHWLSAVFARDDTVLILEVLAIGDFPAENHFAGASGKNIKIVSASVLLGVVEDAVDFRQTEDGLVSKHAIEHEHAEIAGLHMHWAA